MILVTPFCASHDELIILIILNDHVTLLVIISLQVPKLLYLHVADRYMNISAPQTHESSLASESRPSVCFWYSKLPNYTICQSSCVQL